MVGKARRAPERYVVEFLVHRVRHLGFEKYDMADNQLEGRTFGILIPVSRVFWWVPAPDPDSSSDTHFLELQ